MSRYERRDLNHNRISFSSNHSLLPHSSPFFFFFVHCSSAQPTWLESFILMSGKTGFSPIRSTVHVSMLPYSYTNNDVAKLFEPCGRIAQYLVLSILISSVTVLRDRETRQSKGVAWIQFVECVDGLFDNAVVENRHRRPSTN